MIELWPTALQLASRTAARCTVVVGLLAAPAAVADTMRLIDAAPHPDQVMSGSGVAFALRFDHPLDHEGSRFTVVGTDGVDRTVPVRLESQPNVLYGSVGTLSPGQYALHWFARASSGAQLDGTLPFTVRP